MTGLTLDQFKEIVEFARAFHEYGKFYDEGERTAIKMLYPKWSNLEIELIEMEFDIKNKTDIFMLLLVKRRGYKPFFAADSETPLFDRVMAYLKGGEE